MHFLFSAGSDVVSMRCKADRVDGGYIINGNKMWCTNGPTAHTLVVFVAIFLSMLKKFSSIYWLILVLPKKKIPIDNIAFDSFITVELLKTKLQRKIFKTTEIVSHVGCVIFHQNYMTFFLCCYMVKTFLSFLFFF